MVDDNEWTFSDPEVKHEIIIDRETEVQMAIFDMFGKEFASRDYGTLNMNSVVNVNTSSFEAGIYIVELKMNNLKMAKRLVIK